MVRTIDFRGHREELTIQRSRIHIAERSRQRRYMCSTSIPQLIFEAISIVKVFIK
jgi:hypothetical protein